MDSRKDLFYGLVKARYQESAEGQFQCLLVHTTQSRDLYQELLDQIQQELPGTYLRITLDPSSVPLPYTPLLELLAEPWSRTTEPEKDKVLERIYSFHRNFFRDFLDHETTQRQEDILLTPSEILWEQEKMAHSLAQLLEQLLGRELPLVLVLEGLHWASPSLLQFLRILQEKHCKAHFLVLGSFDRLTYVNSPEWANQWIGFAQFMEHKGRILDLDTHPLNWNEEAPLPREQHISPEPGLVEDLLERGRHALAFFAFDEARSSLTELLNRHQEGFRMKPPEVFGLYKALSDLYCLNGELDQALYHTNQLLNLGHKSGEARDIVQAYYRLGRIFARKNDTRSAVKFLRQSLKLWSEWGDPLMKARILVNLVMAEESHLSSPLELDLYSETLAHLETLDSAYYRTVVYCRVPFVLGIYRSKGLTAALDASQEAIRLAQSHGHNYMLSVAYHCRGLVYQQIRDRDRALQNFKKSLSIRKSLGEGLELAKIYNGTGFYCFTQEQFNQAQGYFQKSLELLEEHREYDEIALTLFNSALVDFYSSDYQSAREKLENVLQLMNELELKEIPFHPLFEIHGFLGIACLKTDRLTKSLEYLKKARPLSSANDQEALARFQIWQSLILMESGDLGEAQGLIRQALDRLKDSGRDMARLHSLYLLAQGSQSLGLPKKTRSYLQEGWDLAQMPGHDYFRPLFSLALENPEIPLKSRQKTRKLRFALRNTLDGARQESNLNRLHKKIGEINFLNNLQTIIFQSHEEERFLQDALSLIKNSFVAESVCYFEVPLAGGEPKQRYPREANEHCQEMSTLFRRLISQPAEVLLDHQDPLLPEGIGSLVFLPLISDSSPRGALILATRKKDLQLTTDDLRILSIGAKQISVALDLKEANQKLQQAATTDLLTGLWNRQELQNRLHNEKQRLRRYHKNHGNTFSVLFVDLDNFKYYNDNFGHHVGDLLLKGFAEVLQSCLREVDVAGRFGGDEFILVLPETGLDGAKVVAERIYQKLEELSWFQGLIQEESGMEIKIPEQYRLSCSIGISSADGASPVDVDTLLAQADEALYRAKRMGKHTWCLARPEKTED